tara:strand:- start:535 stop:693 length:159 start_codon:yes stop_codon:yes gene_type:complete
VSGVVDIDTENTVLLGSWREIVLVVSIPIAVNGHRSSLDERRVPAAMLSDSV